MAQLLKLLATKPEDLSSIPRDHMVKGMANLLQNYPLHTHLHQKKKKKKSGVHITLETHLKQKSHTARDLGMWLVAAVL